jgi:O-antigen/teichoic acid export membrane protein
MLLDSTTPPLAPRSLAVFKSTVGEILSRSKTHQTGIFYVLSSATVSLSGMLGSLLVVHWIIPEDLGLWYTVRLALTYSMFALGGIVNGLSRELPFFMGKGDRKFCDNLASTSLAYVGIACLLALIGGVGSVIYFRSAGEKTLLAIGAVTLLVMLTFYTNYLIVTFRSTKSFQDLSKVKLAEGLVGLALLVLVFFVGYAGMLTRVVLVAFVVALLMHLRRPLRVSPGWNKDATVLLLKTGLPIFAMDYLYTSAVTADRVVLLRSGGVKIVGYYALALAVQEAMGVVPKAMREYIYPRMSYSYGSSKDPLHLWRLGIKGSVVAIAIMTPIALVGWVMLPSIVQVWLPKYSAGIKAAQISLLAGVCAAGAVGQSILWSMKAWNGLVWYRGITSALAIGGPLAGAFFGSDPLIGVSLGVLSAQLASTAIGWAFTYTVTHSRKSA